MFINGDCENWKFTSEHIQHIGEKEKKKITTFADDEFAETESEYENYNIKAS